MTKQTTILEAAYALAVLDLAGAVAAVHLADDDAALERVLIVNGVEPDPIDTVAAGYWPSARMNVGTDPLATRSLATARTVASVTRDPFRVWHA